MKNGTWMIVAVLIVVVGFLGMTNLGNTEDLPAPVAEKAAQASDALKSSLLLPSLSLAEVSSLLSEGEYAQLEGLYTDALTRYNEDALYESPLQKGYDLFRQENGISLQDLDAWVEATGSYVAHAARGVFYAQQGFSARGGAYANETPEHKFRLMHRAHENAVPDLRAAIEQEPGLMPAYAWLIQIAKAGPSTLDEREVLDEALGYDNRTYYVRVQYMYSLQPRWGGTYQEMIKFANETLEYVELNPRLYSLLGDIAADIADHRWTAGDYYGAIESFTSAMQYGERISWLKGRAACYYKAGRSAESRADFQRVLYYDPNDSQAVQWVGYLR